VNPGLLELPDSVPPALREPLATLATEHGRKWLWWTLGILLGLGVLAFLAVGANGPDDPSLADGARLHVTRATGEESSLCVLVADSPEERARGLMERTDLGGYDGMAFVFPDDTTTGFHMRNTPLPLTVSWFAADGAFVSSADMAPCADGADCPTYFAAARYRLAVEVPQDGASRLALGPGSTARLDGDCA
jgi:uncharacterized membrane protein (UPF0127 family)